MHWRRKWQPTPVFLPGESQGQGSLVGCCLWGHTESDTTEVTYLHPLSALDADLSIIVLQCLNILTLHNHLCPSIVIYSRNSFYFFRESLYCNCIYFFHSSKLCLFFFNFIIIFFFTLQFCIGFAIHQQRNCF